MNFILKSEWIATARPARLPSQYGGDVEAPREWFICLWQRPNPFHKVAQSNFNESIRQGELKKKKQTVLTSDKKTAFHTDGKQ